MHRRAALVLFLLSACPAAAQEDRVRLEDFAISLPSADTQSKMDQIGNRSPSLQEPSQVVDRQVAVVQHIATPSGQVAQLTAPGDAAKPEQLDEAERPSALVASISTRGESRPQSLQRLSGEDRCDPQLSAAQLDRCLTILENRAAEFSAPEAPELSAEQKILAERQAFEEEVSGENSDIRLRLATMARPDANLRSNQELAALVLEPPSSSQPSAVPDVKSDTLAEALRGLAIEIQNQGASSQP